MKIETLKESVEQQKQVKESAENQIKSMSTQLMTSLENYRRGFDDILERKTAEFEGSKKKLEEENEQLRKQVCQTSVFRI